MLNIGIVTDEIIRHDLIASLAQAAEWGLDHFELREGAQARFPGLTHEEIKAVEAMISDGGKVTAVSPGILKANAGDTKTIQKELDQILPRAIDLALRFSAPVLIVFGFEKEENEPASNRVAVLKAFERVAQAASDAGMVAAVENEPNFWVDQPKGTVSLLQELDHPAMKVNWDAANMYWAGTKPTEEAIQLLSPFIANIHVKDHDPLDQEHPFCSLGQGDVPWKEILTWIPEYTPLKHVTLETHCEPLLASTEESLNVLRGYLENLGADRP